MFDIVVIGRNHVASRKGSRVDVISTGGKRYGARRVASKLGLRVVGNASKLSQRTVPQVVHLSAIT